MRRQQNNKNTFLARPIIGGTLAWSLFATTAHGTITSTPPIVDVDPPSAIVVPVDPTYNRHSTNLRPVTSLDMILDVVDAGITVTDDTDTTLNESTGLSGTMGPLPPGSHGVTWTGTDPGSNSITTTQTIHILPSVNFGVDQTVGEGNDNVTVTAYLSGPAPSYPVDIPFTIDPASTAKLVDGDHDATDGTITITTPNTSGSLVFKALDTDATETTDETVIIRMTTVKNVDNVDVISGQEDRVSVGSNTTHTVTITESNLPPTFDIAAKQGGKTTRTVTTTDGIVELSATATDPNGTPPDPTYDWSASDNALIPTEGTTKSIFKFDPSGLTAGFYSARLSVTDAVSASSTRDFVIKVETSASVLSSSNDTDDDGKADDVDDDNSGDGSSGYHDSDNDGIRNFQDGVVVSSSLQAWDLLTFDPQQIKTNTHVVGPITFEWSISSAASNLVFYPLLLRTEEGLKLSLGPTAFANDKYFARLNTELAKSYWGATGLTDKIQSTDGQTVDIEISNLPHAGASVYIVIPQPAQLPSSSGNNPVFKIMSSIRNWQDFTNDGANNILSKAYKTDDYCPEPKGAYTTVDTADGAELAPISTAPIIGIECVQLFIQDGGPNDYDGQVNGVIRLMGAPFINVEDPPISNEIAGGVFSGDIEKNTQSLERNNSTAGGGASGALGAWFVLGLLGCFALRRHYRAKQ
ncbi:hypothetical protein ACFL2V_11045 [Pseudomonadota bacterium]